MSEPIERGASNSDISPPYDFSFESIVEDKIKEIEVPVKELEIPSTKTPDSAQTASQEASVDFPTPAVETQGHAQNVQEASVGSLKHDHPYKESFSWKKTLNVSLNSLYASEWPHLFGGITSAIAGILTLVAFIKQAQWPNQDALNKKILSVTQSVVQEAQQNLSPVKASLLQRKVTLFEQNVKDQKTQSKIRAEIKRFTSETQRILKQSEKFSQFQLKLLDQKNDFEKNMSALPKEKLEAFVEDRKEDLKSSLSGLVPSKIIDEEFKMFLLTQTKSNDDLFREYSNILNNIEQRVLKSEEKSPFSRERLAAEQTEKIKKQLLENIQDSDIEKRIERLPIMHTINELNENVTKIIDELEKNDEIKILFETYLDYINQILIYIELEQTQTAEEQNEIIKQSFYQKTILLIRNKLNEIKLKRLPKLEDELVKIVIENRTHSISNLRTKLENAINGEKENVKSPVANLKLNHKAILDEHEKIKEAQNIANSTIQQVLS